MEKRRVRDEEGEGPASLGFGFRFDSAGSQPQKLAHTEAFPFRMELPPGGLDPFSTGGGTGSSGGAYLFPFTPAQWQELQRQALIYKHFMSSVPVPPDLVLPISGARSFADSRNMVGEGGGGCYSLRLANRVDPEPGRCRRTDGKKWRCARDVAPEQKYCERHMHRGRPRSRKPVDVVQKPKGHATTTKNIKAPTSTTTTTAAGASVTQAKGIFDQSSGILPKVDLKAPFGSMEGSKGTRYPDWLKGGIGEVARNHHQWDHTNYDHHLNLNYTNLINTHSYLINPNLSPLHEEDNRDISRSFIDAWSTETISTTTSMETRDKLCPLSTLTLSMPGGIEDETETIQMGLGHGDYSTASGGPLAEALRSRNAASAVLPPNQDRGCSGSKSFYGGLIDLMSKSVYGSSHEVSPQESPARLASSPSGVLQKALVSLSDSSSCSSHSFGGGVAERQEIVGGLQWLNQAKE